MKRPWAALILAACLALPLGMARAAALVGTVSDAATGHALAGALVAAGGNDPNQPFDSTWTNAEGHYVLHELATGVTAVVSSREGYMPFMATIELRPGTNHLDIALEPSGGPHLAWLHGHVESGDFIGQPLPGVEVLLQQANGQEPVVVHSNEEGDFAAGPFEAGVLSVSLFHEGYIPFTVLETLEPGPNFRAYMMVPSGGGGPATLHGLVLNSARLPVPGALVLIGSPSFQDSLVTNDEGAFFADGLLAGPVGVTIHAEGYHPFQEELWLAEGPNEATFILNAQEGEASLNGLVTGVDGAPVAHAMATLWSGNWATVAMTGEDGHFHMENLNPGPASLCVEATGYEPAGLDLFLAEGANTVTVVLQGAPQDTTALVTGTVLDALTRLPVAEAMVSFSDGFFPDSLVTFTDVEGTFSMDLPAIDAPGWRVTVSREGYLTSQRWIPAGHHNDHWLVFLMQPEEGTENWGHLVGSVATAAGEPVPFAELEAISADPSVPPFSWSYFSAVNHEGHFNLPVPPGLYVLACRAWLRDPAGMMAVVRLYWPGAPDMDAATPLEVGEHETIEGLHFVLPDGNAAPLHVLVDGTVRDEDGQPLAGARVRVWTPEHELVEASALTSELGHFETTIVLDRLPIVPFSLSAEGEGHLMEFFADAAAFPEATQFLVGGDTVLHNVDFSLAAQRAGLDLSGQVQTENGGQGSALVAAVTAQGQLLATAAADETGAFTFHGLEDEPLALLYYAPGHRPAFSGGALGLEEAAQVRPGDQPQAVLAADPAAVGPCAVSGHVRDEGGQPLAGALVLAWTPASGDLRHAFSGAGGAFLIDGLAQDAALELHASRPGYADLVLPLALDGSNAQTTQTELSLSELSVEVPDDPLPQALELAPASPNPFNPTTRLSYSLAQAGAARLELFNLAGQRVALLVNGPQAAGVHELTLDGGALASGVYLLRLESAGQSRVQRLLLLK
jgi:protocatechuate 3,4-dioxygenase beta subunit